MRLSFVLRVFSFLFLFSFTGLFATPLEYLTNYTAAVEKAQKSEKNLVLFSHRPSCPWCRKMESETLTNPEVIKVLNTQFVFLKIDSSLAVQTQDVPKKFFPKGTPTTYVIDSYTQNTLFTMRGYKSAKSFLGRINR